VTEDEARAAMADITRRVRELEQAYYVDAFKIACAAFVAGVAFCSFWMTRP
jgi:hypothetical protein